MKHRFSFSLLALLCLSLSSFAAPPAPAPRDMGSLLYAERITPAELQVMMQSFGSECVAVGPNVEVVEGSSLLVIGTLTYTNGTTAQFPELFDASKRVAHGLLWNSSSGGGGDVVRFLVAPDAVPMELMAGEMLAIGFVEAEPGTAPTLPPGNNSCSVTCAGNANSSACCRFRKTGYPICQCVKSNQANNCDGGGPESPSCTLSQVPNPPTPAPSPSPAPAGD